jgi:hypothetical protein
VKILQLTTYSLRSLDHGGKLRSYHIREALRRKHTVETLSIQWGSHDSINDFEVSLWSQGWDQFELSNLFKDWGINLYLNSNDQLFHAIAQRISEYQPDILWLEQPYLWPLIERLFDKADISRKIPIVYSSQNIEFEMKADIYSKYLPETIATKAANIVANIERKCILNSQFALAVCLRDAEFVQKINANIEVQVRKNGHEIPGELSNPIWERTVNESDFNWVYIGSAHPPNVEGLIEFISKINVLGKRPDLKFWIIGSVGETQAIQNSVANGPSGVFHILGRLDQQDIDAIIRKSCGIFLPVYAGGGSNLKTAQALLSNKYIAASNFAFRGFEEYINEKGVHLSGTAFELANHIMSFRGAKKYVRSDAVYELTWEKIMSRLEESF